MLIPATLFMLVGGSLADRPGGQRVASVAQSVAVLPPLTLALILFTDQLSGFVAFSQYGFRCESFNKIRLFQIVDVTGKTAAGRHADTLRQLLLCATPFGQGSDHSLIRFCYLELLFEYGFKFGQKEGMLLETQPVDVMGKGMTGVDLFQIFRNPAKYH